ncbi:hypothetical protein F5Y16DRAFT_383783, partial [Xylariaceae sp. FL0255]
MSKTEGEQSADDETKPLLSPFRGNECSDDDTVVVKTPNDDDVTLCGSSTRNPSPRTPKHEEREADVGGKPSHPEPPVPTIGPAPKGRQALKQPISAKPVPEGSALWSIAEAALHLGTVGHAELHLEMAGPERRDDEEYPQIEIFARPGEFRPHPSAIHFHIGSGECSESFNVTGVCSDGYEVSRRDPYANDAYYFFEEDKIKRLARAYRESMKAAKDKPATSKSQKGCEHRGSLVCLFQCCSAALVHMKSERVLRSESSITGHDWGYLEAAAWEMKRVINKVKQRGDQGIKERLFTLGKNNELVLGTSSTMPTKNPRRQLFEKHVSPRPRLFSGDDSMYLARGSLICRRLTLKHNEPFVAIEVMGLYVGPKNVEVDDLSEDPAKKFLNLEYQKARNAKVVQGNHGRTAETREEQKFWGLWNARWNFEKEICSVAHEGSFYFANPDDY